jgi:hypothetical protein
MDYVLQSGLNIGVPYSVPNYPGALNPATDGCRNLTGQVNRDGTATIYERRGTARCCAEWRLRRLRTAIIRTTKMGDRHAPARP